MREAEGVGDALPQQLLRTAQPSDHVVGNSDVLREDHVRHKSLLVPVVLWVAMQRGVEVKEGEGGKGKGAQGREGAG